MVAQNTTLPPPPIFNLSLAQAPGINRLIFNRDPYIIQLNIATCKWWVPFILVLKKPGFKWAKWRSFQEPCLRTLTELDARSATLLSQRPSQGGRPESWLRCSECLTWPDTPERFTRLEPKVGQGNQKDTVAIKPGQFRMEKWNSNPMFYCPICIRSQQENDRLPLKSPALLGHWRRADFRWQIGGKENRNPTRKKRETKKKKKRHVLDSEEKTVHTATELKTGLHK